MTPAGVLALLVAAALLAAGCGGSDDAAPASPSARAVADVAADRGVLLDVRTREEWDAGHADGARHVPLASLEAGTLPDVPRDATVYVYCRTGRRAGEAIDILRAAGWQDLVNVGGLDDWRAAGGPVARAAPS